MGSEKTRSVNSAQTLSLLIHSLGQMLGAVRMGFLALPRYRIGRREKYAIFFLIALHQFKGKRTSVINSAGSVV